MFNEEKINTNSFITNSGNRISNFINLNNNSRIISRNLKQIIRSKSHKHIFSQPTEINSLHEKNTISSNHTLKLKDYPTNLYSQIFHNCFKKIRNSLILTKENLVSAHNLFFIQNSQNSISRNNSISKISHSFNLKNISNNALSNRSFKEKFRYPFYKIKSFILNTKQNLFPSININSYTKDVVLDYNFQKKYINDELSLISFNYKELKNKYILQNIIVKQIFPKINDKGKKQINIIIEKICSFFIEIPYYLLDKFYNKIPQFIGKEPFKLNMNRKINDETKWIVKNLKILDKGYNYMILIFQIYNYLEIENKKEILISYEKFDILCGYLENLRYYIKYLINICENNLKEKEKFDALFDRYKKNLIHKISLNEKVNSFQDKIISNIQEKKKDSENDNLKLKQINNILGNNNKISIINHFELKKLKIKRIKIKNQKSILKDKIVNDLFKYIKRDIRDKIVEINNEFNII